MPAQAVLLDQNVHVTHELAAITCENAKIEQRSSQMQVGDIP